MRRVRLLLAFLAVYVIWGSTYIAIRFAIDTLPPFLMAGTRFLTAGIIMYGFALARGASRPTKTQWREAAIIGALLLLGGNGGVVWAEQRVPTGIAALMIAMTPVFMLLLDWLAFHGPRPTGRAVAGMVMGFAGLLLLVGGRLGGGHFVDPLGATVLVLASFSWSLGSVFARQTSVSRLTVLGPALEMIAGGVLMLGVGLARGEAAQVHVDGMSVRSLLALAFLVFFGSIVAYTAYTWLLSNTKPVYVSTYAYVNPVVAVLLGWLLAHEPVTATTLLAAAVIVTGVALITTSQMAIPIKPVETTADAA